MKYVLDSSVAFKWVVRERDSDNADRLRVDLVQGIHEYHSPDVFPVEIAHSLTRAERQGRIHVGDAENLSADVLITPPVFHPYRPLLVRAVVISSKMRVGVYDCLYVVLAETLKCKLITSDDKLIKTLSPTFPFIISLASLP